MEIAFIGFLRKLNRRFRFGVEQIMRIYFRWRVRISAASYGEGLDVGGLTILSRNTFLADFVNFNGLRVSGLGRVTIGRYFHSGRRCELITSFHNYDFGTKIPYGPRDEDIHLDISIGDFVWLGDGVTILGGVSIGEGAIIQAGSVVTSDIPAMAVAGGHPAKVFKYRNANHFNELKSKGQFL
jgi:acetyltransferase-like isoleucine patch superfamily enzyme